MTDLNHAGAITLEREIRNIGKILPPEERAQGMPPKIVGYAVPFNSQTNIGGPHGFMEQVAPGSFTDTIANDDIRALFNHDDNIVLGRTSAGTLTLTQDDKGLRFEITPPDTTAARDLMTSIQRGDISECSFGFSALDQSWDDSGDMPLRTIRSAKLFDVSPVTRAAYSDTAVAVRSLDEWRSKNGAVPGRSLIIRSRLRMRSALHERELAR